MNVGTLIYLGVMPLVKTFITMFLGYMLARMGLFPQAASRGASQVIMNLALPGLIFASIVPAFTPSNVSALGPLILLAFLYQIIGLVLGYLIREVSYVPRNFYQGLVIMCTTSNWGNLPTAVVVSVTQTAPFDPTKDPALGVSFISIFILVYNLVFWVFGGAHTISWDYLPDIPQGDAAEKRLSWKEKPIGGWIYRKLLKFRSESAQQTFDSEKKGNHGQTLKSDLEVGLPSQEQVNGQPDRHDIPSQSHSLSDSISSTHLRHLSIREDQNSAVVSSMQVVVSRDKESSSTVVAAATQRKTPLPISRRILHIAKLLINPQAMAIFVSLPIALVKPLKALFVDTRDLGGPTWHGPDGRPPLFFIIDTASFVGSLTVPIALIVLGASFANLKIPRPLSRLPLMAMALVTLAKMVIIPVFGVLIVQVMVNSGFIPRENKAERFVAMFLSGTPAAVNQLIATQLYAPDGKVDTLSAFLLVQYIFMFFGSAVLTAVSLSLL